MAFSSLYVGMIIATSFLFTGMGKKPFSQWSNRGIANVDRFTVQAYPDKPTFIEPKLIQMYLAPNWICGGLLCYML